MNQLSNKTISRIKRIAVVFGIIIIPLLYSYLYLGAFWDPYSRLDVLPIAIVNADQGASINGQDRNLGEELIASLKEDGTLTFTVTTEDDARTGTKDSRYYAEMMIPSDFSKDIASAQTTDKTTATLSFSANEKRNYLASQIMKSAVTQVEEKLRSKVDSEIVQNLSDKLAAVPVSLVTLSDGLGKLSDGAAALSAGTKDLSDGTATFAEKMGTFKTGVSDAASGSTTLSAGAVSLDTGIDSLLAGARALSSSTEDIGQITDGAVALAAGAKTMNSSLSAYITGVDSLIASVNSTSGFLKNYATVINPSIMKDPYFSAFMTKMSDPAVSANLTALSQANVTLKTASQQIADGAQTLSSGTASLPELKTALTQLESGLEQAKEGSAALSGGAADLETGLADIDTATGALAAAADQMQSGAADAADGASSLSDGISTAKTGVDDSITAADADLTKLDGLSDFAAAPVTVENTPINPVVNYGTAFAPYFLSLSLWVGALMIFLGTYMDNDDSFTILSRNSKHKYQRSFIYLGLGLVQAVVLGKVLELGLGLSVSNEALYYLACCLFSVTAVSIVQFFMVNCKAVGKFLCIVILILQLTSCGGTFPMETVPGFFNVLYPFMPMTYSVGLLKEAISGGDNTLIVRNAVVLILITAGFTVLSLILTKRESSKAKTAAKRIMAI